MAQPTPVGIRILVLEQGIVNHQALEKELSWSLKDAEIKTTGSIGDFEKELRAFPPTIVLCDFTSTSFNWSEALTLTQNTLNFIPFVLLVKEMEAEEAVELMKQEVTDVVFVNKLHTLSYKITRALAHAEREKENTTAAWSKIKYSEDRLNEAQSIAHVGSWEYDFHTTTHVWSKHLFNIFGIEQTTPSLDLLLSFIHTDDMAEAGSRLHAAFEKQISSSINFRFVRKDGIVRFGYSRWRVEFDTNQQPLKIYGTFQDVTDKKIVVREFQEAHNKLLFHLENAPMGFIEWNGQLQVKSWSKHAQIIFGWTEREFREKQKEGFSIVYHEDNAVADRLTRELIDGDKARNSGQYRCVTKDGKVVWCEWFNSVLRDKNGKIDTVMSLVQDITERKKAEEEIRCLNENLENRVRERTAELTDANIALEAFSYSVSHDLRSPVRTLLGFAKIIGKDYGAQMSDDFKQLFTHIERSGKQMNAIIDSLLTLARYGKEKLSFDDVDLGVLFQEGWRNTLLASPHKAKLILTEMPVVYADGPMLQQVIANLLSNAVKYSAKRDTPIVEIGFTETPETVTIYVRDNGAGFDMEAYDRLFGAFQRLHSAYEFEGTGVGLMLIKRIIDRHGGEVWAEGKVDEGATFYFSLPKNRNRAKELHSNGPAQSPIPG